MPVTIYLMNGFQLKGLVRGFDNYTIILDSDGKQQLVYKHAVSTIAPFRAINLNQGQMDQEKLTKLKKFIILVQKTLEKKLSGVFWNL